MVSSTTGASSTFGTGASGFDGEGGAAVCFAGFGDRDRDRGDR